MAVPDDSGRVSQLKLDEVLSVSVAAVCSDAVEMQRRSRALVEREEKFARSCCAPLLEAVLEGRDCACVVLGARRSGKSRVVFGAAPPLGGSARSSSCSSCGVSGVVGAVARGLWSQESSSSQQSAQRRAVVVEVAIAELYAERSRDLLRPDRAASRVETGSRDAGDAWVLFAPRCFLNFFSLSPKRGPVFLVKGRGRPVAL